MKKHFLTIFIIILFNISHAQEFFNTDRIGGLSSAFTLKKSTFQLEYGLTYQQYKTDPMPFKPYSGGFHRTPYRLNLRFGFLENFEFGISYMLTRNEKYEYGCYLSFSGIQEIEVFSTRAKIQLVKDNKLFEGLSFSAAILYIEEKSTNENLRETTSNNRLYTESLFTLAGQSKIVNKLKLDYAFGFELFGTNPTIGSSSSYITLNYLPIEEIRLFLGAFDGHFEYLIMMGALNDEMHLFCGLQFHLFTNLFFDLQYMKNTDGIIDKKGQSVLYDDLLTGGISWNIDFSKEGFKRFLY